jgi:hypothetical protein
MSLTENITESLKQIPKDVGGGGGCKVWGQFICQMALPQALPKTKDCFRLSLSRS